MIKTREKITLPSGATCVVRRLSGQDFVVAGLSPVIADLKASSKKVASASGTGELDTKALQGMVKITSMFLYQCAGMLRYPDGRCLKIVNKPLDDLGDNEITIEELDQADADAIVSAVHKLSGLTKEAAAAATPFPEEQAAAASAAPDGERLRLPANGAAEA